MDVEFEDTGLIKYSTKEKDKNILEEAIMLW